MYIKWLLVLQTGFSSEFKTPDCIPPVTIYFHGQRRNQIFRLCFESWLYKKVRTTPKSTLSVKYMKNVFHLWPAEGKEVRAANPFPAQSSALHLRAVVLGPLSHMSPC